MTARGRLDHRPAAALTATRVFTRIWLALSGLWSWDDLPVIPPEVIYLPSWFPLNIYDWGCWARQTIVALAVVVSLQAEQAAAVPGRRAATPRSPACRPRRRPEDPWSLAFNALDKALHTVEPRLPKRARRAALRRCIDWIIARQEADGCWGGIQPPWVYSIMALHLMGYGLDNPVVKKAIDGLERFTIREDGIRRLEACQSPVWDTVLSMIAPGRRRARSRTTRRWSRPRQLGARRGDPPAGRLAGAPPAHRRPAAGRSSSTTTTTPTPTTPPR